MNQESSFKTAFRMWLPLAVAIVVLSGLVYVVVQQNYRMSANDPQIQIAQDIAAALSQGTAAPDSIVPANPTTEMSPSLATFVTIYSATGTPIGSSVALSGKLPTLPSGVFDAVKQHGENRFTWQPEKGTRIAAVVTKFSAGSVSGYILAGRSLKEVEAREMQLTLMTVIAVLVALVLTYLVIYFLLPSRAAAVPEAEVKNEEQYK